MHPNRFAPLTLALVWLVIVSVDATTSLFAGLTPWTQIVLGVLAAIICWVAWRFHSWFQFSTVSQVLFLPTFGWAAVVLASATQLLAEVIIPVAGGGHTLAFAASVLLVRSLVAAVLFSAVVVIPLVIVYRRHAPVVAAILCLPIIGLELWHISTTRVIAQWLVGAELTFLFVAFVGFAWLVSRKGMLSNLSLNRTVTGGRPSAPAGTAG